MAFKKAGWLVEAPPPPICKQNDLHDSSKLGWPHKKLGRGVSGSLKVMRWVVVNMMVPFGVPVTIRHLIYRVPKKGSYFDNHPDDLKR